MTRGFDRSFALMFLVMLTIAAGNTALQSVLPALGRSLGVRMSAAARVPHGRHMVDVDPQADPLAHQAVFARRRLPGSSTGSAASSTGRASAA